VTTALDFSLRRFKFTSVAAIWVSVGEGTPSPRGYFWRNVFRMRGLQGICACKIFHSKELQLKYLFD
jgi:hypothetical protein